MKTKWAIIISVAIVAVVLVAIFWKDIFKKVSAGNSTSDGNTTAATFPLKYGSKGAEVKETQRYLNKMKANFNAGGITIIFLADLVIDGVWGAKTQAMAEKIALKIPVTETDYNQLIKTA